MLLGPGDHAPRDLNILVKQCYFSLIDAFFRITLSYEWVDHDVAPHDAFGGALEQFVHYRQGSTIITVSSVSDTSLFKAVLAAPSTADMVFMTPGKLCTFYPTLTLENNAILSSTGFLVEPEMSIGSVWSQCFHVYDDARFLTSECAPTCPSLWQNVRDDGSSLIVQWDHQYPLRNLLRKSHTIWRLTEACVNAHCKYCSIPGIRRSHLPHRQALIFKALLYAMAVMSPHVVPVHLQEGREHMECIDDLEVNFWVNTLARNKFVMPISRYRKTFHGIPDYPTLPLPYAYTIYHEDPQSLPPPNALMRDLFSRAGLDHGIKGNVLVIKHPKQDRNKVLDVTEGDLPLIHMLLDGGGLSKTLWNQFK
ncbi:uncharacterized protein F5147DRAFT_772062 [Suillus discolor]|uniref:Uncharacterized protein n=1 Tax=Suillus discolor TaxID=1912936 RepID=A0A9P7F9I1_9AGAM|nr:uncharacterized protein F5147DRAFT_772062 [Suillus discolor]KAG2111345.1 hypothetical protein F5147DRAFT_772062 [Suillus discolor]